MVTGNKRFTHMFELSTYLHVRVKSCLKNTWFLQASYVWQNSPTDKFDTEFIERRRAALEV